MIRIECDRSTWLPKEAQRTMTQGHTFISGLYIDGVDNKKRTCCIGAALTGLGMDKELMLDMGMPDEIAKYNGIEVIPEELRWMVEIDEDGNIYKPGKAPRSLGRKPTILRDPEGEY